MEAVLKNSVSNNYYGEAGQSGSKSPSAEILKELSDSRYTVFDVLPTFFSHTDPMVSLGKCSHNLVFFRLSHFFQLPSRYMFGVHIKRIPSSPLIMRKATPWMMVKFPTY